MKKVEQVTADNRVVLDYDVPLSVKEIGAILAGWMGIEKPCNRNPFKATYKGKALTVCAKAVTYLGHPHSIYKKRIQIPAKWRQELQREKALLLGVYQYKGNTVFVIFDTAKYKSNRLNNSSAHVHTIDIQKAVEFGTFSKEDSKGNVITACRADSFGKFLDNFVAGQKAALPEAIGLFDDFINRISTKWLGKKCYLEMLANGYRNAKQAEWPGFYFEYLFEQYSNAHPKTKRICVFVSRKGASDLDFDLNFYGDKYLGDLKCHAEKASAIPGNDKKSVDQAIRDHGKLWYVVLSHSTEKDSKHGYKVTEFWNSSLGKENNRSYGAKMKYSVRHNLFLILELNKYNRNYIEDFPQGCQPDGSPRKMKIKIPRKALDNFLIYKKAL